jgi:predicted alpha/beta-hydrolase family hydrolase
MAAASGKTTEGEIYVQEEPIRWIRNGALRNRPVYLFAHGAGAASTSDWMQHVATGLHQRGITVVRFNFPYMERAVREGRRRPPDAKPRLLQTCRQMFEMLQSKLPAAQRPSPPIVVGGKSMGGRMMSILLAEEHALPAAAAVYLGYPLHPPGRPTSLRTAHLSQIGVAQLFVSGSRDPLGRIDLFETTVDGLGRRARLHRVEGGDHSLSTSRKEPLRGSDAWLDVVAQFLLDKTRRRLAAPA